MLNALSVFSHISCGLAFDVPFSDFFAFIVVVPEKVFNFGQKYCFERNIC